MAKDLSPKQKQIAKVAGNPKINVIGFTVTLPTIKPSNGAGF